MSFSLFHRNPQPDLDQEAAGSILSNIFEHCDREPNRTSMEDIRRRKRRSRLLTALCWILATLVLTAVLVLPVAFATAQVEILWVDGTPAGSPVLQINADSFIPIRSITAMLDDQELAVHEVAEQVYQLYPDRNGLLVLTVTLTNNHSTQATVEVVGVDQTPPQLVSSSLTDGVLEILLTDADSPIDFAGAYALDMSGGRVEPLGYDPAGGSITFAFPDSSLNIFVCDACGNQLQLVLTVD